MIRHWSHTRQKGWGYPPKKTACQSGLRFQRYKPLKSVTTAGRPAGRPLILRFLVYISRNSLRASRSLVTKHTKTNDTSTSLSFTQHNSYFVKNKIIILFFLFFLLILLAIDKCNRASSLAISVSQHCERAFRTPFICLCAPYMKRHSLRRSIEPKEGHKTTGALKNIFSILYLMYRSKCSL